MAAFTFSMPCLSRYVFYEDGKVRHSKTLLIFNKPMVFDNCFLGYELTQDNGNRTIVDIAEIIQYGKHMKATNRHKVINT